MTEDTIETTESAEGTPPPDHDGHNVATAFLAMLGFPVGAHRWYLGHVTAGAIYLAAFAALALAWFGFRERVTDSLGAIWTIAVVLVVLQLVVDAIALPRWARGEDDEIPVPGPLVLLLGVLAVILVLPTVTSGLGSALATLFGNPRIGQQLAMVVVALVGVPLVLVAYLFIVEKTVDHFPIPAQRRVRPWLWLAPALGFLYTFLVYPAYGTIRRSLYDQSGEGFIGMGNYQWFFSSPETLIALRNNVLWLVFFTALTVGFGLLIAVLVDRVRYESFAKTTIFVPMAISFVAASVVWRFMYVWNIPGTPQTGTLNAIWTLFGGEPVNFLATRSINNFALIVVASWVWVGFCMVILSAGIKSVDTELMEAARVDGANEWQVFRRIILPLLAPTLAVVTTTMIIFALKTFDIVYAMTAGNFDTQVIALSMWNQFAFNQYGRASAVAVVLLLAIIPVMAYNIKQFRSQEEIR